MDHLLIQHRESWESGLAAMLSKYWRTARFPSREAPPAVEYFMFFYRVAELDQAYTRLRLHGPFGQYCTC